MLRARGASTIAIADDIYMAQLGQPLRLHPPPSFQGQNQLWRMNGGVLSNAMASMRGTTATTPQALITVNSGFDTDDIHDSLEIVGEHLQSNLGGDARQTLHSELRRAHARLGRAERVVDRFRPLAHGLLIFIEEALSKPPHQDPIAIVRSVDPIDRLQYGASGSCPFLCGARIVVERRVDAA
jgi:hypothetical protein